MNHHTSARTATFLYLLAALLLAVAIFRLCFSLKDWTVFFTENPAGAWHLILADLTLSVLLITGFHAVMLGLQGHVLRHKRNFHSFFLPLELREVLLCRMLSIGFILLSLILLNSMIFLVHPLNTMLWHKLGLSLLAWLIFLILLISRGRVGWRSRLAIRWTLTGIILVILAYFGSEFI